MSSTSPLLPQPRKDQSREEKKLVPFRGQRSPRMKWGARQALLPTISSLHAGGRQPRCSQHPRAAPGPWQSLHLSWENPEHFQPSPIHICVYYFFCPPDWQWATLFVYFLKESTVCLSVSYRCQCLICLGWQKNKWTYYATFKSPSHPSMCSSPFCCPSRPAAHTDLCPCLDLLWCSEGIF